MNDLSTVLLELPVPVVERTNLPRLEPPRNAVKVERMVANTPSNSAFFTCGGCLICLAFDAKIHNVVSADSAIVDDDIPRPKGYCIPLLDFEALLSISLAVAIGGGTLLLGDGRLSRRVGHVNVGHG